MLGAFRNAVQNNDEAMIRRLFNQYFPEANVTESEPPAGEPLEHPSRPHAHSTPQLGFVEK
jgi:hypothetical protein